MSHLTYLKTCFKNFRYLDKALKQLNVNQKQTSFKLTGNKALKILVNKKPIKISPTNLKNCKKISD